MGIFDTKVKEHPYKKDVVEWLGNLQKARNESTETFGFLLASFGTNGPWQMLGYRFDRGDGLEEVLELIAILDDARKHQDPGIRIMADRIWLGNYIR